MTDSEVVAAPTSTAPPNDDEANDDIVTVTTTATTVINDVEATSEEAAEKAGEETAREEEPGCKVFVGNLAFKTTEPELAAHFGEVGKVLKANIITRGTRSLGYGFVALETEEEAKQAVEKLNKGMLDGREINVELAKPKTEGDRPIVSRRGRGGRFNIRGRGRNRGRGRGRGRGRSWPRRRFGNREDGADGTADGNDAAVSNVDGADGTEDTNANSGKAARGAGGYRRRSRGRGRNRAGRFPAYRRRSTTNTSAAGTAKTGDPSKTSVFVANLLFSVNDEELKAIFPDYKIKAAHVVRRRGGRSKGFGFVEFEDEAEQSRLLKEIDENDQKFYSDQRELVIKAALNYHHEHSADDDDEKAAGADEEPQDAPAAPATPPPAEKNDEGVSTE